MKITVLDRCTVTAGDISFAPIEKVLVQSKERGHAYKTTDGRWRLTTEGFLVSNSIISDLLLIQDSSEPLAKRR